MTTSPIDAVALRIADIKGRIAAATPGEWWLGYEGEAWSHCKCKPKTKSQSHGAHRIPHDKDIVLHEADCRLIAHAKSDMEYLLGLVDDLEAIIHDPRAEYVR